MARPYAIVLLVALALLGLRMCFGCGWVMGDSMEPTLSDGAFVVYRRLAAPCVGDVVSAWAPSDNGGFEPVIHRITAMRYDGQLTLRGDNGYYDECCYRADVRGVVVWPPKARRR